MKKKLVLITVLIMAFLLLAVSCNSGSSSTDSTGTVENKKILTVAILNGNSEKTIALKFKAGYEKQNTGVTVRFENFSSDYNTSIFGFISSGKIPDVIWTAGDMHAPYSSQGIFLPLNDLIKRDNFDMSDFYPSMVEVTKVNPSSTEIYFMPRDYNKVVLAYNKDMFDAAGLAYPNEKWTWEDLKTAAKTLRAKMDANANGDAGLSEDAYPLDGQFTWAPVYYAVIKGFGGDILNEKQTAANINTTNTKKAIQEIYNMIDQKLSINPADAKNDIFLSKKAAMWFTVRPRVSSGFKLGVNMDFTSFPILPENNGPIGIGCSGYAISAKSKNVEEAWGFLKYIGSAEGQKAFSATGSGVPVLQSLSNDKSWTGIQVNGKDINHSAFIAFPKRDLQVNYANGISDLSKQKDIVSTMGALFSGLALDFDGKGSVDGLVKYYTEEINNIIE